MGQSRTAPSTSRCLPVVPRFSRNSPSTLVGQLRVMAEDHGIDNIVTRNPATLLFRCRACSTTVTPLPLRAFPFCEGARHGVRKGIPQHALSSPSQVVGPKPHKPLTRMASSKCEGVNSNTLLEQTKNQSQSLFCGL